MPTFGHLPLILGPDKKRLSKRYGATSVEEFRNEGILPQALYNFLALLGWNPGDDREILSRDEMIRLFTVDRLNASPAVFDREKLLVDELAVPLAAPTPRPCARTSSRSWSRPA